MNHQPVLSVIIVNYNTRAIVLDCLDSVYRQDLPEPYEVIVVDNASTDGSVEAIQERFPQAKVLVMPENVGFGRANNAGVAVSSGGYVLLLNSDTLPGQDTFRKCLAYLNEHPSVGMMGCKLVLPSGTLDRACRRGLPTPWNAFTYFSGVGRLFPRSRLLNGYSLSYLTEERPAQVDSLSGAFMFVRREVFVAVGGFDPDYFFYGEDIDLCYRIKRSGWEIHYAPVARVVHLRGGSTAKGNRRASRSFYDTMWLFYSKHLKQQYHPLVTLLVRVGVRLLAMRNR